MNSKNLYSISILLALFLGISSATWLFVSSARSLVPWGIAALIIGWLAKDRKRAVIAGSLYGFILTIAFMLAGYGGPKEFSKYLSLFLVSVLLGLIGIACGTILSLIGNYFKKLSSIKPPTSGTDQK